MRQTIGQLALRAMGSTWARTAFAAPAMVLALGAGLANAQATTAKLLPESCKQPNPLIGVALPNTSNPYYIAMRQSFLDHGKAAGFKVAVAIADNSDSRQLSQIDAFIQQKVCAVALKAVDSAGTSQPRRASRCSSFPRKRKSF